MHCTCSTTLGADRGLRQRRRRLFSEGESPSNRVRARGGGGGTTGAPAPYGWLTSVFPGITVVDAGNERSRPRRRCSDLRRAVNLPGPDQHRPSAGPCTISSTGTFGALVTAATGTVDDASLTGYFGTASLDSDHGGLGQQVAARRPLRGIDSTAPVAPGGSRSTRQASRAAQQRLLRPRTTTARRTRLHSSTRRTSSRTRRSASTGSSSTPREPDRSAGPGERDHRAGQRVTADRPDLGYERRQRRHSERHLSILGHARPTWRQYQSGRHDDRRRHRGPAPRADETQARPDHDTGFRHHRRRDPR